jgi:hypothetical protein
VLLANPIRNTADATVQKVSNFRTNSIATHIGVLIAAALSFSACATPVGVVRVDPRRVYEQLSASALSTGEPSSFSVIVLKREKFNAAPEETLQHLHQGLPANNDKTAFLLLPNSRPPRYCWPFQLVDL